jgi:hypothetical protein
VSFIREVLLGGLIIGAEIIAPGKALAGGETPSWPHVDRKPDVTIFRDRYNLEMAREWDESQLTPGARIGESYNIIRVVSNTHFLWFPTWNGAQEGLDEIAKRCGGIRAARELSDRGGSVVAAYPNSEVCVRSYLTPTIS